MVVAVSGDTALKAIVVSSIVVPLAILAAIDYERRHQQEAIAA
jgi:hypothetical protein